MQKKKLSDIKEVKNQMDEAFKAINVASKRQQDCDDTDYFCPMLVKKIKKMDEINAIN